MGGSPIYGGFPISQSVEAAMTKDTEFFATGGADIVRVLARHEAVFLALMAGLPGYWKKHGFCRWLMVVHGGSWWLMVVKWWLMVVNGG